MVPLIRDFCTNIYSGTVTKDFAGFRLFVTLRGGGNEKICEVSINFETLTYFSCVLWEKR